MQPGAAHARCSRVCPTPSSRAAEQRARLEESHASTFYGVYAHESKPMHVTDKPEVHSCFCRICCGLTWFFSNPQVPALASGRCAQQGRMAVQHHRLQPRLTTCQSLCLSAQTSSLGRARARCVLGWIRNCTQSHPPGPARIPCSRESSTIACTAA